MQPNQQHSLQRNSTLSFSACGSVFNSERALFSRKNLGETAPEHHCKAPDAKYGYRFSRAMENPGFIGIADIQNTYLPMGFSNFKIEGRGLGSALILEFLLYYLTKPDYQLRVREEIYLDNALDLF